MLVLSIYGLYGATLMIATWFIASFCIVFFADLLILDYVIAYVIRMVLGNGEEPDYYLRLISFITLRGYIYI
jgi:hypothetical protein